MSDYAFYVEVESVRPIPKADRIQVATVMGYDVATSKDIKPGDRGILITEGAQVDEAFALDHNLLRYHPQTGEKLDGYLEENRRVRAMRLCGQNSEGIFVSAKVSDDMVGKPADGVATKYETPAQHRARVQSEAKAKRLQTFPMHYDTAQLRTSALDLLRPGLDRIIVTEKLHGTSGRTASVRVETLGRFWKTWNWLAPKAWARKPKITYQLISGTRRVILDAEGDGEKGMSYRQDVHNALASIIQDGERWYYEIVGYGDNGVSIMPPHDGEFYSYGCTRDGQGLGDRFKVYVYRVVDADGRELGMDMINDLIVRRSEGATWIDRVPVVGEIYDDFLSDQQNEKAAIMKIAKDHSVGQSTLDTSHIREGVCLRSEGADGYCLSPAVKYKSFAFCMREGIRANDDGFVDPEDVS